MSRRIALFMLMAIPFASCVGSGSGSPETEARLVRQALDGFFDAVAARDWPKVESLIADDFEFYGDDLMVLSRADFMKAIKEDDMKIRKLELTGVKTTVSDDGRLAWVKYQAYLDSDVRGEPYRMNSAETVAFRREAGQWRMTHNHASVRRLDSVSQ